MVEHTRTLGFKVAFALGLGTMIAAGIFSLSGKAVASVGSSAVIAFVIAAVVAAITAASYSEFASIYSENGGGYLFTSRTLDNSLLLYAIGASLFMGYSATTAFYLGTMDHWVTEFVLPPAFGLVGMSDVHVPHGIFGVLTAIGLGYLNAQGTEESGTFQVLITGAKVAVLFAFIGGAFVYAGPTAAVGNFTSGFVFDKPGEIISVAALAFITFFGFSAIAASAGEIIEPRETVPKAIAASIVTVTILYTFVIVAMVNAPVGNEVLQQGETAMGKVAASFLGSPGQALIVAGAIFSMVSASNASILAASSIGDLMAQRGQAPRRLSRIHPEYNTPIWSIVTCTGAIVALIVVFVALFPAGEGGIPGPNLGLEALTGFANLNLLIPLSVVNAALILSRRRFPDIDRPFKVPAVPFLPILGILANLALVVTLPLEGIVIGVAIEAVLVGAYLVWGGAPESDDIVEETTPAHTLNSHLSTPADGEDASVSTADRYTVLVPVSRPHSAKAHARLADAIARRYGDNPVVKLLTVTQSPEQTEQRALNNVAAKRAERIIEELGELEGELASEIVVEGHISRDVAFDILSTARDDQVDRIVMGYPRDHPDIAEEVEYDAPCDVLFAGGFDETRSLDSLTIGAGGGPHHEGLLSLASSLADGGTRIHVVDADPIGDSGTAEDLDSTLAAFDDRSNIEVHDAVTEDIAGTLVDVADETNSVLAVGASRNRVLRRWVFGSTADRVVRRAKERDVPVLVYARSTGLPGRVESALFTPYRYALKVKARA
ncbi:amino acid permease [Halogranum rubrum]|uniref:Amino acid permease-associated region n=1 Tax=Halogranum salarium B-1 TaxID=1210908 RepID=J3JFI2_9EURY|nr:amino acid permease [Halogranum salarium]EJN59246.1 amino acid permease-associated region [Halogranum salarium B-1]